MPRRAKHRVLIVDDTPAFSTVLARFWNREPDIDVIGIANSAREALEQLKRATADLIVMDIDMPEMNGLEAASLLKKQPNCPPIILMTFHDPVDYRKAALENGADEVVSKSSASSDLLPLIRALSARKRE